MPAYEPFEVDFLVSGQSGQPLVFNLIIEGVNMLLVERQEIGALLDRNSGKIDALIIELKAL
jgi:phospholipid transport system substrate-binding protein